MTKDAAKPENRRRVRRDHRDCSPITIITESGEPVAGELKDLSVLGIGLLASRPFESGAILKIQLKGSTVAAAHVLPAKVVHAIAQADDRWLLGCAFLNLLSVEDAAGLR